MTKEDWRDVVRRLRPDVDDEQFELLWKAFERHKRRRRLS